MKRQYQMTDEQLQVLIDASQPTVAIEGWETPQDYANRAWADLGRQLGFDSGTVEPIEGMGFHHFRAEPNT